MLNCIVVGIGGFIGTVCRYLIGLIPVKISNGFPIKTLAINIAGAFLIGLIAAIAAKNKSIPPQIILMLRVGVCGGFTTFSTFAYESVDLIKSGGLAAAACYIGISILLGIAVIFVAEMLIK